MVPYATPAIVLIILDLIYGCKAAAYRQERVRFSTAIRRTLTKSFSYVCWIILASTLALSFEKEWLEWIILGMVYLNELSSIIGNYFEAKGLKINWGKVLNAIIGIFGQKTNTDTSGVDVEGFVEPMEKKVKRVRKPAVKKEE